MSILSGSSLYIHPKYKRLCSGYLTEPIATKFKAQVSGVLFVRYSVIIHVYPNMYESNIER